MARVLAEYLRGRGYSVLEQPLDRDRINVIAAVGEPELVFSTHFDCVPPFFPSRVEDGVLHGRGACDAKGILAAQVAAAERLRAAGETRVGLVFVVGEERGSDGAKAANTIASKSRYLINGEPTELTARPGDARRLPRPPEGARQGRPFRLSRPGRVGDREAARRAARPARRRLARRSGARPHALHRGAHQRRRGAERRPAARRGRGVLPHRRRPRRAAGGDGRRGRRPGRGRGDPRAARRAAAHAARLRHRGLRLLQRRAVPLQLGHAAAVRSRHHPRGAHRPRAGADRRPRARRRRLRRPGARLLRT